MAQAVQKPPPVLINNKKTGLHLSLRYGRSFKGDLYLTLAAFITNVPMRSQKSNGMDSCFLDGDGVSNASNVQFNAYISLLTGLPYLLPLMEVPPGLSFASNV